MSDVAGTVATFTIDRIAYSPSPPIVFAVVELRGPESSSTCEPDRTRSTAERLPESRTRSLGQGHRGGDKVRITVSPTVEVGVLVGLRRGDRVRDR
jgi:hypothetical protein